MFDYNPKEVETIIRNYKSLQKQVVYTQPLSHKKLTWKHIIILLISWPYTIPGYYTYKLHVYYSKIMEKPIKGLYSSKSISILWPFKLPIISIDILKNLHTFLPKRKIYYENVKLKKQEVELQNRDKEDKYNKLKKDFNDYTDSGEDLKRCEICHNLQIISLMCQLSNGKFECINCKIYTELKY